MKLRVVEHRGRYYPQRKGWFFWNYFYDVDEYNWMKIKVVRYEKEDAIAYCKRYERDNAKAQVIVWEN